MRRGFNCSGAGIRSKMVLTEDLISVLACPQCRGDLRLLGTLDNGEGFLCAGCGKVYPIYDGVPVLLVDKAIPRADWDAGERGKRP